MKAKSARKDLERTRQQPDPLARQPQLQRQLGELRKKGFVLVRRGLVAWWWLHVVSLLAWWPNVLSSLGLVA